MKRISGLGLGGGFLRRIWWIVGTAVYQLALWLMKSVQNSEAENLLGTTMEPPVKRGARRPQRRPWTWNRGMTSMVRSLGVRSYVFLMLSVMRLVMISEISCGETYSSFGSSCDE